MTSLKETLKRLDNEGKEFKEEMMPLVLEGKCDLEEILGFSLDDSKTRASLISGEVSPRACLAIYDLTSVMVTADIASKEQFASKFHFTPEEIAMLAEKGRILPCFNSDYSSYPQEVIEPFLGLGIPHVSTYQLSLTTYLGLAKPEYVLPPVLFQKELPDLPGLEVHQRGLCLKHIFARGLGEPLKQVFEDINRGKLLGYIPYCVMCFAMFADRFLVSLDWREVPIADSPVCSRLKQLVLEMASRKCIFNDAFLGSADNTETIVKGLRILYSREIPLEDYIEITDGKATRAAREVMMRILADPLTRKYRQRLSSKIYEFNREVEEANKHALTRLGLWTSDLISYNLKKYAPSDATRRGIEWLASATLALQSRLLRRDWAVLQLCKTRKRLGTLQ